MRITVNFTREPIIETIISPKEGSKLIVRSSKNENREEYCVDAVEIVSFGSALFYRSIEKPKPFLAPVADYEVIEAKETRVVLKNAQFDRAIKIGGGREASVRREPQEREEETPSPAAFNEEAEPAADANLDRNKRDRHRRRRRRAVEEHEEMRAEVTSDAPVKQAAQEVPVAIPMTLIPPPPKLISETIDRYKQMFAPESKVSGLEAESPPQEELKATDQEEPETGESSTSRSMLQDPPQFSPLPEWSNFLS